MKTSTFTALALAAGLSVGATWMSENLFLGCDGREFGSNSGLSICGEHPYPLGYKGTRVENKTIDGTVRHVMVNSRYQWSIRNDTDGTFVIHDDGPAGSAMNWPDTARILIEPRTGVIHIYGKLVVHGSVEYR